MSLVIRVIILSSDVSPSDDTGVVGVGNAAYGRRDSTLSRAFGIVTDKLAGFGGFNVSARTLSGLNRNKPLPLYTARIFLFMSALSLAELYRYVKCCLLTVPTPPRSIRST